MTNAETGLTPRRRKASAALPRRTPHERPKRDSTMTRIDHLIEVAKKLTEARALAERCSDRALLYFIDMTIAHACDALDASAEAKSIPQNQASPIHAAA
jgi:hypothetical protein